MEKNTVKLLYLYASAMDELRPGKQENNPESRRLLEKSLPVKVRDMHVSAWRPMVRAMIDGAKRHFTNAELVQWVNASIRTVLVVGSRISVPGNSTEAQTTVRQEVPNLSVATCCTGYICV